MNKERKTPRVSRKPGYLGAIIANLILVYVFNNLFNWHVPFLTSKFSGALWAINLSLGVTIVGNVLFLAYDDRWFHHLIEMARDIVAILAAFVLYSIFPFSLSPGWTTAVRIGLIVVMVGIGIAFIVELVKLVLNRD